MLNYEKEDFPEGEMKCYRDIICNALMAVDMEQFHSKKYLKLRAKLMYTPPPGEFIAWEIRDLVNEFVLDMQT